MTRLDEPLRTLLGERTAKALATGLELHTVGELLRHYPRRYATRGELTDLAALTEGEQVTVMAEIAHATTRGMRNRRGKLLEVVVTDGHGRLTLTFFNQPWRERELLPGRRGLFAGKVSSYRGRRQLAHPDYQLLPDEEHGGEQAADRARAFADELIPVYAASARLPSWRIAQCVRIVLDELAEVPDPLPPSLRERRALLDLREAYRLIHRPDTGDDIAKARKRLKWDEAFVLQVALAQRRRQARSLPARPRPPRPEGLLDAFDARLPFELTSGQREVGAAIAADLDSEHPMHRLLQGDVGAGKTLVALRAMLQTVDAGGQAALLAPTEVLAQQHYHSIGELLGPLARAGQLDAAEPATRMALLTGSQGAAARRRALLDAASGDAGLIVGTHALLQEHVSFADLGLVVVDEQHRFGVEQRDALREKAADGRPHVLVMTATPIPRTVAMTVYGDLDVTALDRLPYGRRSVATHVVPAQDKPHYLRRVYERIREEVAQGHQAYIVCPRVGDNEESEDTAGADLGDADLLGVEHQGDRPPMAVVDVAAELAAGPLAGVRLEALHGRLPPEEKEAVMHRFASGETDVLVATTVIEVGVDVHNATVMAIMDADRFGVSQLHQLRGRIGRGGLPGVCLLVTNVTEESPARERLAAVAATNDGFDLSRVDLEQRREGDVLGDAQSGRRSSLRMLALLRDEELITAAREEALTWLATDPSLSEHPPLATALRELFDEERAEYLEKA